jgi:cyclopropane-fatty-acyl-phospholipid synthase
LEYTRERIAQEKLEATCHVELTDYRQLQGRAQFDKIASVGMFEHVGASQLGDYFRHAARLLTPGGAFLNHGIATRWTVLPGVRPLFQQQVFPDTEMVPLSATLWAAESAGFEVRDVESLREHYALTLRHWVSRLEARASQARGAAGERAYRLWRLYMAGAAHYFTTGDYNVYQTLLLQPRRAASGLPLTREDWYR